MSAMRKTIVTIALMATAIVSNAQELIPCELEVTYSSTYSFKKEARQPQEDMHVLQVGKDGRSRFYSQWSERNDFVMDSLLSAGLDPMAMMQERKRMGVKSGQSYRVFKNIPSAGRLTYADKFMEEMYYEEPMPAIDWKMEEGDTVIAEYSCQKAVGTFRGRTWTAWFSMDIPVSDGPWKLCGLPGLILKASEADGYFSFTCIGISKGDGKSFSPLKTKGMTKASLRKMQELKDMSVNDVRGMIQNTLGLDPGEIRDQNGEIFRQEKTELVFMETAE